MLIGSKYKLKEQTLQLKLNDNYIENVTVQKVLGVYVDNTLSWNLHLNKLCAKINSKIALLKRISNFLT